MSLAPERIPEQHSHIELNEKEKFFRVGVEELEEWRERTCIVNDVSKISITRYRGKISVDHLLSVSRRSKSD